MQEPKNLLTSGGTTAVQKPNNLLTTGGTTAVQEPNNLSTTGGTTAVQEPNNLLTLGGTTTVQEHNNLLTTGGTTNVQEPNNLLTLGGTTTVQEHNNLLTTGGTTNVQEPNNLLTTGGTTVVQEPNNPLTAGGRTVVREPNSLLTRKPNNIYTTGETTAMQEPIDQHVLTTEGTTDEQEINSILTKGDGVQVIISQVEKETDYNNSPKYLIQVVDTTEVTKTTAVQESINLLTGVQELFMSTRHATRNVHEYKACHKIFSNKSNLKKHLRKHFENGKECQRYSRVSLHHTILNDISHFSFLSCMQQVFQEPNSYWSHESFKEAQWFICVSLRILWQKVQLQNRV